MNAFCVPLKQRTHAQAPHSHVLLRQHALYPCLLNSAPLRQRQGLSCATCITTLRCIAHHCNSACAAAAGLILGLCPSPITAFIALKATHGAACDRHAASTATPCVCSLQAPAAAPCPAASIAAAPTAYWPLARAARSRGRPASSPRPLPRPQRRCPLQVRVCCKFHSQAGESSAHHEKHIISSVTTATMSTVCCVLH